jgi:hypothetical protein
MVDCKLKAEELEFLVKSSDVVLSSLLLSSVEFSPILLGLLVEFSCPIMGGFEADVTDESSDTVCVLNSSFNVLFDLIPLGIVVVSLLLLFPVS